MSSVGQWGRNLWIYACGQTISANGRHARVQYLRTNTRGATLHLFGKDAEASEVAVKTICVGLLLVGPHTHTQLRQQTRAHVFSPPLPHSRYPLFCRRGYRKMAGGQLKGTTSVSLKVCRDAARVKVDYGTILEYGMRIGTSTRQHSE